MPSAAYNKGYGAGWAEEPCINPYLDNWRDNNDWLLGYSDGKHDRALPPPPYG